MKKVLNLSVILAVLVAAFSFTSCGGDEEKDAPVISVGLNTNGDLTGTIKSDSDLKSVTLERNGNTVTGFPVTSFGVGSMIVGKDGSYNVTIPAALVATVGNYALIATDKSDLKGTFTFKVEDTPDPIEYKHSQISVVAGNTYGFKQGSIEGTITIVSIETGKVVFTLNQSAAQITLSDAGTSYLGTNLQPMNQAAAVASPANVLFCLLSNSTNVASGTLASNTTISGGANPTLFSDAL